MAMEKHYTLRDTHTRALTAIGYNPARREILIGCEGRTNAGGYWVLIAAGMFCTAMLFIQKEYGFITVLSNDNISIHLYLSKTFK